MRSKGVSGSFDHYRLNGTPALRVLFASVANAGFISARAKRVTEEGNARIEKCTA
jgi:hypothetical protein